MNRLAMIGIAAVVVGIFVIAAVATYLTGPSRSERGKITNACSLLTLDDAKKLLGPNTTASKPSSSAKDGKTDPSNCSYGNNNQADLQSITVSIKENQVGDDGKSGSPSSKPANAKTIVGYGDDAYYDPSLGQLVIVKKEQRVVVVGGPSRPKARTIDFAKQIGNIVAPRL